MDVARVRLIWSMEDKVAIAFRLSFNKSYVGYIRCNPGSREPLVGNESHLMLNVLDLHTGKRKSRTKIYLRDRNGFDIAEMRVHPHRELIFISISRGVMVFSTTAMDWVGMLQLPDVTFNDYTCSFPPRGWKMQTNQCETSSGPRDTISFSRLQFIDDTDSFYCFVIHHFKLPTDKEIEVSIPSATKVYSGSGGGQIDLNTRYKTITNWKRDPVEIVIVDDPGASSDINVWFKQCGVLDPGGEITMKTWEENIGFSNEFHVSAVPGEPAKAKSFTLYAANKVTKKQKNLPNDHPNARTWFNIDFPGDRWPGDGILSIVADKYMVLAQAEEVFWFDFSPPW